MPCQLCLPPIDNVDSGAHEVGGLLKTDATGDRRKWRIPCESTARVRKEKGKHTHLPGRPINQPIIKYACLTRPIKYSQNGKKSILLQNETAEKN